MTRLLVGQVLTAAALFAAAPFGAVIRVSDGTPRPPERFKNKLRAWEGKNFEAFYKEAKHGNPDKSYDRDSFTLQLGSYGYADGAVALIVNMTFGTDSASSFEVIGLPREGALIVTDSNRFTGTKMLGQVPDWDRARALVHEKSRLSRGVAVLRCDGSEPEVIVPVRVTASEDEREAAVQALAPAFAAGKTAALRFAT